MHYFSTAIERRAEMRRGTPSVSGMQRAYVTHRSSPLLFRLFNRGKVERESNLLPKGNASPVPENAVRISGEEQAKITRLLSQNISREAAQSLGFLVRCARAIFAHTKIRFGRGERNSLVFGC
jgi:hypothetical protein